MASTSNRRQSTRAIRTSIARPANYYARPHGYGNTNGASSAVEAQADANPPGFYPAITYFTDAIDALPKEVVRHFTLLKESEGKAYQPEQALAEVVKAIRDLPPSDLHTPSQPQTQGMMAISLAGSINGNTHGSVIDGQGPRTDVGDGASQTAERSVSRQQLFDSFNVHLRDMIVVLEEKQTILHQASDCIERQLFRLDDVMPHLDNELSEEARLGSNTHWALAHMKELRKPIVTNERTRRDMQAANNLAAAAAHVHESDITATRSEARREALLAKRGRHNMDSDFDDRPTKKPSSGNKARKEGTTDSKAVKRRRADKGASTAEKPAGPTLNGKAAAEGPAEPPKKKTKAPTSAAAQAKRKPTNASPSLANLSPTRSTFPATGLKRDHSPAPSMAKAPSSRGRQNSAAGNPTSRPASSASHLKPTSGLGIRTPELKGIATPTSRPLADARGNPKIAQEPESNETLVEEPGVLGAFATAEPPKPDPKLDALPTDTAPPPPDADTTVPRARPSTARTAKTSAPDAAPMSRSRSSRGQHAAAPEPAASSSTIAAPEPRSHPPSPRRSHKKSASRSNAYQEAIAAETLGTDADEVDEDDENDETASNDPIYCVCNRPSFGDMIACDNDACPTEWFHLECVGLTKPPSSKTKWYCEACKASMKQGNGGR